ncbi:MAG: hypothetical protein HWN79_16640 [Candidatus Lokiarchaeota archaeon]|nr:hypothetical protein [Candidatus Lokiarchaeota archaeon]
MDYFALIDVDIVMSGAKLAQKSCDDYFKISWNTSSSLANFTIEIISDDWFNPSLWLKKEVNIIVNLRKDIVFDINATVKKGNVKISVPWGASVNNVEVNNVNGNILYDFDNCVIKGNIVGNITEGDFKLKSYNVECTQDVNWTLNNDGGDFNMSLSIS